MPQYLHPRYAVQPVVKEHPFNAVKEADAAKYVASDKLYCEVLVNGEKNLLNGQPYLTPQGVLEINAVITYIQGVKASYDDKVNVFRINW